MFKIECRTFYNLKVLSKHWDITLLNFKASKSATQFITSYSYTHHYCTILFSKLLHFLVDSRDVNLIGQHA